MSDEPNTTLAVPSRSVRVTDTADIDQFYSYWNDLLDGKKPPFYDGKPQGGVYAMKRGEARVPVRIDKIDPATGEVDLVNGRLYLWLNGEAVSDGEVNKLWIACGRNAVSDEAYAFRMKTGRWPDEAPRITAPPGAVPGDVELGIYTDNQPPPEEVHELLPYTIARVRDWFKKLGKFSTPEEIQTAADHANALRTLKGKAEKQHKEEKAPHLTAGKAVDDKFLPSVKDADGLLKEIGRAVALFEEGERKQREAAEAKARQEAEAKAQEALRALASAPPEKQIEAIKEAAALMVPTPPTSPSTTRYTSSTGKKGFTVKAKAFAEVIDQDALYMDVKNRPEVVALLAKIAQAELDSGVVLAGVLKREGVVAK